MAVPHSTAPQEISHPLKCAERGCAFLAAPGETFCSYHAETFSAESSYVESSLSREISYRNAVGDGAGFQTEPEWQHVIRCRKQWDAEGRCVGCGGQRDKLTKNCSLCLTEKKRISDALRAAGRCYVCRRELDRVGRDCSTCNSKLAEGKKIIYRRRMRNGQCVVCGAKNDTPQIRCRACKRKVHRDWLARIHRRRAAGVCASCGVSGIGARRICHSCAKRQSKCCMSRYRRLKYLGICPRCKNASDRPHRYCSTCVKRDVERDTRRYRSRAELGLCPYCGGSRDHKFRLCAKCRQAARARARASAAKRIPSVIHAAESEETMKTKKRAYRVKLICLEIPKLKWEFVTHATRSDRATSRKTFSLFFAKYPQVLTRSLSVGSSVELVK